MKQKEDFYQDLKDLSLLPPILKLTNSTDTSLNEELKTIITKLNKKCELGFFHLSIDKEAKEKISKACAEITKEYGNPGVKFLMKECKKEGNSHGLNVNMNKVNRYSSFRHKIRLVIEIDVPESVIIAENEEKKRRTSIEII